MFRRWGLKITNNKLVKKNYHNKKTRSMVNFSVATKFGVLVTDIEKNKKVVNKLVKELKLEGKSVHVLCYGKSGKEVSLNFEYDSMHKKDISWKGKFKGYGIKKFIKSDFDYLFSLNTSPILPFRSILAMSNARCRVGMYNESNEKYFDLMVHPTKANDLAALVDQMIYYTKKIK